MDIVKNSGGQFFMHHPVSFYNHKIAPSNFEWQKMTQKWGQDIFKDVEKN